MKWKNVWCGMGGRKCVWEVFFIFFKKIIVILVLLRLYAGLYGSLYVYKHIRIVGITVFGLKINTVIVLFVRFLFCGKMLCINLLKWNLLEILICHKCHFRNINLFFLNRIGICAKVFTNNLLNEALNCHYRKHLQKVQT